MKSCTKCGGRIKDRVEDFRNSVQIGVCYCELNDSPSTGFKCEHDHGDYGWKNPRKINGHFTFVPKKDESFCPFCSKPKASEAVRTVEEIAEEIIKEGQTDSQFGYSYSSLKRRIADALRHERERKA